MQNTQYDQVRIILHELRFPIHHCAYRRLCIAIPRFASNPEQSLTKELYPYIAREAKTTIRDVESCIRKSITSAWKSGDRSAWDRFFPGAKKPPTNLTFIATLADHLQ